MKSILHNILQYKTGHSLFLLFFRGPNRRNRGPKRGQSVVEEAEGHRQDRGPQRGQGVIEGKRAVEETEGSGEDRGL